MAETEPFDPKAAAQKLLSMSGLEGLRYMMAGNHPPPSIAITLGFILAEVEDGRARDPPPARELPQRRHGLGLVEEPREAAREEEERVERKLREATREHQAGRLPGAIGIDVVDE